MTARDELKRDIEATADRFVFTAAAGNCARGLLDSKAAILHELTAPEAQDVAKPPSQRTKVIEFPGKVKTPRKTG